MLVGLIGPLSLALTACETRSSNELTNRLVVAQASDATSLDPQGANDVHSALVNTQIFETLVIKDDNSQILPGLAERWELLDDGLTYEFYLRENVYFHNGEEFTATDVEFTFLRALDSPHVAHILGQVDPNGIKVINDYKIQIATLEPNAPFLQHLAHSSAAIMNRTAVTESGEQVGQNPVGTGPFQFEYWLDGEYVQLKRYEKYYGEKPAYKELMIKVITDNTNRTLALKTGEVDITFNLPTSDVNMVEKNEHLRLFRLANFITHHIGFNLTKEPFNNVLVRQAINYAVNASQIIEDVLNGVGEVATSPISSNVWGARADLAGYEFNLEKAKKLMLEAGYENGFSASILTANTGISPDIVFNVVNQLSKIGIEINIRQLEWGSFIESISGNDHEMYMMGWSCVTGDADYGLYSLFHSSQGPKAGNRTFFADDRVDELLDLARSTININERLEAYYEVQEIIVEEAPWLYLVTGETLVGARANVRGFRINPGGHHKFASVYFQ